MNMNLYLGMNRALKHTIYGIRSALMAGAAGQIQGTAAFLGPSPVHNEPENAP